jgi:hypothetical protein
VNRPVEQAMIREALALLRPRSGRLDDVPAEMVSMLLGEVSKALAMLRADGFTAPPVEAIERLVAAVGERPGEGDTLRLLLRALADFADPVERWWREDATEPTVVF